MPAAAGLRRAAGSRTSAAVLDMPALVPDIDSLGQPAGAPVGWKAGGWHWRAGRRGLAVELGGFGIEAAAVEGFEAWSEWEVAAAAVVAAASHRGVSGDQPVARL